MSAVDRNRSASVGGRMMFFREEQVTPVYRRWMCEQVGCNRELLSTGEGITRLSTRWKHRCGKCGHEDWADTTYPRVASLGPDDAQGIKNARVATIDEQGAVDPTQMQSTARRALLQDVELMPQYQDFGFQSWPRLEPVAQHADEQEADC